MVARRITKRVVDALKPQPTEYTGGMKACPVSASECGPSGAKSYIVTYRAGAGRGAPVRRYTIQALGRQRRIRRDNGRRPSWRGCSWPRSGRREGK